MRRCYLLFILMIMTSEVSAQIYSREADDSLLSTLNQPLCDSCRVNTLITIADFILHQRRISKYQLDSVGNEMAEVKKINYTLHKSSIDERLVLLQAMYFKATNNKPAGMQLLVKLSDKLLRENNQLLLGKVYYELSDFYNGDLLLPTMNRRIYYLKLSIAAFKKTTDRLSLGRDYRFLADLHMMTDSMGGAFVEANNALSLYHAVGYKDIQGILALLGRLYFSQQNYKQAINYELMALNAAKKSKQDNVRLMCQIDNSLGTIFLKLNDFPNCLYYFNQALDIAKQENDNGTIYLLAANLVDAYLKAGRRQQAISFFKEINNSFPIPKKQIYEAGDFGVSKTFLKIYIALNLFDKARPYYERVLNEANNPHIDFYSLSEYYALIARTNIGLNNYALAQVYLDKNEKILFSLKDYSNLSTNYRLKAALDTAQGKFRAGMRHILMAQKIEDSLFNVVKSHQIGELQVAYLTSEKESQISFFQQKANIERANLQKANLIGDFSLAGVVGLLIIAALLYRQNRQKRQHNKTIVESNRQLGDLLAEKEWLLKEVHHRVKNNLHTVVCLLESQASFLTDEALYAVESSRCRIYAMSLIHQKFYQSDDINSIEMKSYISELVQYLGESFGFPAGILTHVDVPEINLSISNAIPVGLIINEAVNNAYKYAFPNQRSGEISICLKMIGTEVRLTISDNGVGIPFDPTKPISDSLGIELMKGLATDLKGSIKFLRNSGTCIIVSFKFDNVPGEYSGMLYA
jgi:two-component system, sensor histidine kinase PdtaS